MPTRLGNTIDTAIADRRLLLPETQQILEAAGNTISTASARKLGTLSAQLTSTSPAPDGFVYATAASRRALDTRFAATGLPFGANESTMRAELSQLFELADLGTQLSRASRTASLLSLTLRDDRARDGTRQTVFFTADSHRAFYRVDGGGRGQPGPRWFGPLDLHVLAASARVQPLAGGMISPERINTIRSAFQGQLNAGALAFDADQLPDGRFVRLGVLHTEASGAFYTVYLPVAQHGENVEQTSRYVIERELDGVRAFTAETAIPTVADPRTDGQVSDGMRTRARNLYFDIARREVADWKAQGPASNKHLVFHALRGAAPTAAFVVERDASGAYRDPDFSSEVWFRHGPTAQWSGPHPIEPLYR